MLSEIILTVDKTVDGSWMSGDTSNNHTSEKDQTGTTEAYFQIDSEFSDVLNSQI